MNDTQTNLLHHDAGPKTLVFAVKFMFAIWFVRYLIDPVQLLSELPVQYSSPVGLLKLFPTTIYVGLHSFAALVTIKYLVLASCAAVWIPKFRLRGAIIGCVSIGLLNAITRGFGHINHAEISPLLVTCILTLFLYRLPQDQIECPDNNANSTSSTGMILATLCFALTYSFVGAARLVNGGIEVLAGDTITNSMVRMSHHDWLMDFNLSGLLLASPLMLLMLKLGTAAVTVFELVSPLCLVSSRFRKCFLLFVPAFHIGAILIFKIDFIENVLTMLLFLNLTAWINRESIPAPAIVPFGRILFD